MVKDMPKLNSPFARRKNEKGDYVVIDEVEELWKNVHGEVISKSGAIASSLDFSNMNKVEDYSWVFNDETVIAVEKLHGTNVSIVVQDGQISSIWNRTERLPFFNKGKVHIVQGIMESYDRGYCDLEDGQWFGELIGEKVNGNPYNIQGHLWLPFKTYCAEKLYYKSWGKYPKTFETMSEWFKTLMPLYSLRIHGKDYSKHFVEGIVFTHPDGRMAKLRGDMFDWWTGARHKEEKQEVG